MPDWENGCTLPAERSASFLPPDLPPLLPSHLEVFLASSPLGLFVHSRLEDGVPGSTIDARASNDLIMDSLESAVDENVRTSPEINGAKREGSLRTGGGRDPNSFCYWRLL